MCLFTFVAAEVFLFATGEALLPFNKMLEVAGVIILLAVLASASMVLLLVSFFKTSNAFAAASTVIGTLLGFLAGIYIPIGSLARLHSNGRENLSCFTFSRIVSSNFNGNTSISMLFQMLQLK